MSQTPNSDIYIGLDVGSTKACCVIGLAEEEAPAPSIIGVGSAPLTGVRKGVVVDIEETVSAISAAVEEAERIAGVRVERASIGVNGSHIATLSSQGIIAVGGSRDITIDDVERVEEAAATVQLPPNREIIQVFARAYSIDGQEHVKDPIGMSGMRLEVETKLVTGATPSLRNLERTITQAGISVDSRVVNPVAAAEVVLDKRQRELGSVVIDLGGGTTGLAVYEEGELLATRVIPVGSSHITNDLAIGLRTDIDTAEKVKREHVRIGGKTRKSQAESLSIKELSGDVINVSQSEINDIARARLEEIFELVNEEITRVKPDQMLPAGAFLTGGGANVPGIEEFAKEALRLPVKVARPKGFSGIIDKISDPAYAVATGLMLENKQVARDHTLLATALSYIKEGLQIVSKKLRR